VAAAVRGRSRDHDGCDVPLAQNQVKVDAEKGAVAVRLSHTLAGLATRVNLSPSPCLARVRHLEKVGVIDRRIAVLDPNVLGLSVTAFIHIKLEKQVQLSLDNFTRAIDRISQVMECCLMTGESDYLFRVLVPDIEDLEDLIVNILSRILSFGLQYWL
jgi:Lrp/AsnC family leucine-responsive transcriptional regulator